MSVGVNGTGQPAQDDGPQDAGAPSLTTDGSGLAAVSPPSPFFTPSVFNLKVNWEHGDVSSLDFRDGVKAIATYRPEDGDKLRIYTESTWVTIPADEVIKVAKDMQRVQRQEPEDSIDVDHQTMLSELLKHIDDDDGSIQVLEGLDNVAIEHFGGTTSRSLIELIHFIKVNNLQEERPWCVVWNLYRCMSIAAGKG